MSTNLQGTFEADPYQQFYCKTNTCIWLNIGRKLEKYEQAWTVFLVSIVFKQATWNLRKKGTNLINQLLSIKSLENPYTLIEDLYPWLVCCSSNQIIKNTIEQQNDMYA